MLSFLKIRAVINGHDIYPLSNTKPVVIPLQANHSRIVITDGFHITRPLKLVYKEINIYCFQVVCIISDWQLAVGFTALALSYLAGMYTGLLILKIASFLPLVYLLLFYYLNREQFLRLKPVVN